PVQYALNAQQDTITGVGIRPTAPPSDQYVHGILVEGNRANTAGGSLLFSYDFLNNQVIDGRDRSQFNDQQIAREIYQAWTKVEDDGLLDELIRRCFLSNQGQYYSPERKYLVSMMVNNGSATQQRFVRAVERALGLTPGNNLLIRRNEISPVVQEMMDKATARGFHIVLVDELVSNFSPDFVNAVNGFSECTIITSSDLEYSPEQYGWEAAPDRLELRKTAERTFQQAKQELISLLVGTDLPAMGLGAVSCQTVDRSKLYYSEAGVELQYDQGSHSFVVLMRPDSMLYQARPLESTYWRRRIQTLLLATLDRAKPFAYELDIQQTAQGQIQRLVDQFTSTGVSELAALPERFAMLEEVARQLPKDEREERLEQFDTLCAQWDLLRRAERTEATVEDLTALAAAYPTLHSLYKNKAFGLLSKRIIVRDGKISYGYLYTSDKLGIITKPLRKTLDAEATEQLHASGIYKVAGHYVYPFQLDEGDTVVDIDTKTPVLTKQGGELFGITDGKLIPWHQFRWGRHNDVEFDDGTVHVHASALGELTKFLYGTQKIEAATVAEDMIRLNGTIESSLTMEYGKDHWDDPQRILLDLIQNHLDAAGSERIEVEYEVLKDNERRFVPEYLIGDGDNILAIKIRDYGTGYAPNHLGTLGASRKVSPLQAGKYGEGQKLLAAAARRHGLELTFSSVAPYQGQAHRWTATAQGQPLEIVRSGRRTQDERIVFQLHSEPTGERVSSESTLRLPEGVTVDFWNRLVAQMHPRSEPVSGQRGLARIVRQLRYNDYHQNEIDVGCMKVLPDEPGAIYENGLLVQRIPGIICGYDLPNVTNTRERNRIDQDKLKYYIAYAQANCRNPQYADRCVASMVASLRSWTTPQPVAEHNLHEPAKFASLPLWDQAIANRFRNRYLHSDIAIAKGKLSTDDRIRTLFYAKYLPVDQRATVSAEQFDQLAGLLPTTIEYTRRFARMQLAVPAAVISQLEQVVAACATAQKSLWDRQLKERPGRRLMKQLHVNNDALSLWTVEEMAQRQAVSVAPREVGYHGIIDIGTPKPHVNFNEDLLRQRSTKLVGTIHHELAHHVTQASDYEDHFLVYLLELAFDAKQRQADAR
ncbi:MAG: hypothetical protein HY565_04730, partial [Candidatus Kerfeldbacteria bacterium]|nr:hypothetical protein [Candidatus Kerfeldbacteria bacterium]